MQTTYTKSDLCPGWCQNRMMLDLESLTLSHVRLHDAQLRAARAQLWLIVPLAVGVFALMAWWANPVPAATAYAPVALLASLLVIAAALGYALVKGNEAGFAARELTSFHNLVLAAQQDEGEDPDDTGETPRAG